MQNSKPDAGQSGDAEGQVEKQAQEKTTQPFENQTNHPNGIIEIVKILQHSLHQATYLTIVSKGPALSVSTP